MFCIMLGHYPLKNTDLYSKCTQMFLVLYSLDHTNPFLKQLGIFKFVDLVKFKTSIIMFKAYHNELPDSLEKMYKYMILAKNILSVFIVPIPT